MTDLQPTESLPTLPKIRKASERDITPIVLAWLKANHKGCAAIEVKITTSGSIPANAVAKHQLSALRDVLGAGLVWKIPDIGYSKKPFDAFMLSYTSAFVVCCFSRKRLCIVINAKEWRGATPSTHAQYSFKY